MLYRYGKEYLKKTAVIASLTLFSLAGWVLVHSAPSQGGGDPWRIHPRWAPRENPETLNVEAVRDGASIWRRECAECHGDRGRGDGPQAPDLRTDPGDLTDPAMWEQSDGALAWKTLEGRSPMPSFRGDLSEEEVWKAVHYIRTLAPRPPNHPMPSDVRDGISAVLDAYFDLAAGLAESDVEDGDTDRVHALGRALPRLDELDAAELDSDALEDWTEFLAQLRDANADLREATDADELGSAFAAFSDALIEGVKRFGHAQEEPLILYSCAQALNGDPASWLVAAEQEPRNPYPGDADRDCVQPLRALLGVPAE